VSFEQFISKPNETVSIVAQYLGLGDFKLKDSLPTVMAVEKPSQYRWRKRGQDMLALANREDIKAIMKSLGYSMDPTTWL
jgi:hypothetical protein